VNPSKWQFQAGLQQQILQTQPEDLGRALDRLWNNTGQLLVDIALGQQFQENGPPIGGVEVALKSALAQGAIFVVTNEDARYAARAKLTKPGGLLTATLDPREAARIAQDALRREDPKR